MSGNGEHSPKLLTALRNCWRIVWLAICKYTETDGELRAASFAYYAFFALFPLILLLISIGSWFVAPMEVQEKIISFVRAYMPFEADADESDDLVMRTIAIVVKTRGGAGLIALVGRAVSRRR